MTDVEIRPPAPVVDIAERLERAGFETWCVGGAIRDLLLGHPHLDWDLATAAPPAKVRSLFQRTVPVGIEFGTVGVLDISGTMHEVTTFRRDVHTDGRHAVVEFGASLDDDLARRDFTINAIAYSPSRRELHDPFDGRGDLERRLVRAVGDARERMREDRLRALRAIRFAARFEFRIDPATWVAILESAPHLGRLSPERVKQELEKTMEQVRRPSIALAMWRESGALRTLVPSLAEASEVTLASLDMIAMPSGRRTDDRRIARLTALFAELPSAGVESTLRALRFSNSVNGWVTMVVKAWQIIGDELTAALLSAQPIADSLVRHWVAIAAAGGGRTRVRAILRLGAARWAAQRAHGQRAPEAREVAALYRRMVRSAFRDAVTVGDLSVDGDDLRTLGIPPGPEIGRVLAALLEDVIADPARNTQAWLLGRASALHERHDA